MKSIGEMLTRCRNAFLLSLLVVTLIASSYANRERLKAASSSVDIPVTEVAAQPISALDAFRQQRDEQALNDISALERLCNQSELDKQTREDAAAQLQAIVDARRAQAALEGALAGSSLYPCAAVVQVGSVTLVTQKTTVTDQDAALVLSLAAAHTGISPENVRIITAE